MRKKISAFLSVVLTTLLFVFIPNYSAHALSNGTYTVPYTILESGSNNVSIANGYFSGSAKVTVKNGVNTAQLTLNEAQYVKSLSGPYGAAQVVSDSGKTRVVNLQVGDLNSPVNLKMHVVVPEEVAGMEYDHHHTATLVFDTSGLPSGSDSGSNQANADQNNTNGEVANPPTGDQTPIGMYVALILGAVAVYGIDRVRLVRN